MLAAQLEAIPHIGAHRSALYTVLSELYSNALDYGVLGLESVCKADAERFQAYVVQREQRLASATEGFVRLEVTYTRLAQGGEVVIMVTDSGPGFEYDCGSAGEAGEQGLRIVRGLCRSLVYNARGNVATATYAWSGAETES